MFYQRNLQANKPKTAIMENHSSRYYFTEKADKNDVMAI